MRVVAQPSRHLAVLLQLAPKPILGAVPSALPSVVVVVVVLLPQQTGVVQHLGVAVLRLEVQEEVQQTRAVPPWFLLPPGEEQKPWLVPEEAVPSLAEEKEPEVAPLPRVVLNPPRLQVHYCYSHHPTAACLVV
jgi:hypothetical protein